MKETLTLNRVASPDMAMSAVSFFWCRNHNTQLKLNSRQLATQF